MASDLARTSLAAALFSLVIIAPGYLLGWTLDLMKFRRRSLPGRAACSILLSIGIAPIAAYLLEHYLPALALPFFIACGVALIPLVWWERCTVFSVPTLGKDLKRSWPFLAIVGGWMAIAILTLIDLQIGDRLYFPTVTCDYTVRSAITSAITRTGVPPQSPFFYANHTWSLHYHYFWFILCSIVQRMGGSLISPRQAMLGGTAWAGAGLAALVATCSRAFRTGSTNLDRHTLIALALLGVTGLDIIPVVVIERLSHGLLPSADWWNEPVGSWANAALWLPHHLAGLIACMTGYLVLRHGPRIAASIVAGLIFAASLGLSVYVTLTFALALALWMAISLARKQREQPLMIAISGVTAAVVSIPFLRELLAKGSGTDGGGFPFQLAVRPMRFFDILLSIPSPLGLRANVTNLALLPLNYALELGFYLIGAVVCGRRMWQRRATLSEGELFTATILATSLILCTFVRSSVIENNDLGMRGFLIAQLVLLLWGADMLAGGLPSFGRAARLATIAALLLGVAGSVYEVAMTRLYGLLLDTTSSRVFYRWLATDRQLGARTYALREIYEELKAATPDNAIFQHNPDVDPEDPFHGMYADRQVVAETRDCTVEFGGDTTLCPSRIATITDIFDDPGAFSAPQIDDACERLSISVLVVKDTDNVWNDRSGWVWTRTPMFANHYARAFACGAPKRLLVRK